MDTKQYLESGVLELYVLGQLSDAETKEVAQHAADYPEIAEEINNIELALEELAFTMSADVDPNLLPEVLKKIKGDGPGPGTGSPSPPATGGSPGWIPWVIAIAGFLGAGWFWQQGQEQGSELSLLQAEYDSLRDACDAAAAEQENTTDILATLTAPGTRNIALDGTENAPDKKAVVFYNPTEERTLFTASNLPAPPSGKQYQLWAIDGDGPKSLGVLDLDLDNSALLAVDHYPGVAAFAITLEDLGGKPQPDLSQLQVIGEVS